MKKKYPSYQDAFLDQVNDFNLVQDTKILADGSVEVKGWGTEEKAFPNELEDGEGMLDQLMVRSAIIIGNKSNSEI